MNIKILAQNIANNPSDFTVEQIEKYFQDYAEFRLSDVISWVKVSEQLPKFGETVLVHCNIYGRFLATYEFIGEFHGEKYGNWRDFNGNLGILPPVYWLQIPEPHLYNHNV